MGAEWLITTSAVVGRRINKVVVVILFTAHVDFNVLLRGEGTSDALLAALIVAPTTDATIRRTYRRFAWRWALNDGRWSPQSAASLLNVSERIEWTEQIGNSSGWISAYSAYTDIALMHHHCGGSGSGLVVVVNRMMFIVTRIGRWRIASFWRPFRSLLLFLFA